MNLFGRKSTAVAVKSDGRDATSSPTTSPPAPVPLAATPSAATPSAEVKPAAGATTTGLEKSTTGNPVAGLDKPTANPAPLTPVDAGVDAGPTELKPPAASNRLAFLDKGSSTMTATTPTKPPAGVFPPGGGRLDQAPRRTVDSPASGMFGAPAHQPDVAPVVAPPPAPSAPPQRRLTVGRDILLAGEIASCDVLVVEGTVEAKLRDGHSIEVADTGLFKGSVEIDEADIAGRFEGDLLVRHRLKVRATGKITGSVVYGELEVEAGGQVVGSIKLYDATAEVAAKAETTSNGNPAPVEYVSNPEPNNTYMPVQNFNG